MANTGFISARVKKSDWASKKRKKLTPSIFAGSEKSGRKRVNAQIGRGRGAEFTKSTWLRQAERGAGRVHARKYYESGADERK
jgi:hypothetical protein